MTSVGAMLLTLLSASAPAQTIRVPDLDGDQLIFIYDARTNRVPFLYVSNPSDDTVFVEVAFYPANLASRLGDAVLEIGPAANEIIDPTQFAGGVANGNAGLAVMTPVVGLDNRQPIVPPEPLTGGFTLANVALGSGFGNNPFSRFAVTSGGAPAAPGSEVDGDSVRYERFTPDILNIPVYFNPAQLGPPENDGNRVLLAAFDDDYGSQFNVTAASDQVEITFLNRDGSLIANTTAQVNGVLLSDLQTLAGGATLSGSGKVFFDVDAGGGNVFGVFAQSVGTFAAGQAMPAVAIVPSPVATPIGPTPTPVPSGGITPTPGPGGQCTVTVALLYETSEIVDFAAVEIDLTYPSSVSLPANPDEVNARATNLTGLGGALFSVSDEPGSSTLNIGVVSIGQSIPPGNLASVRFNCASAPQPGAFACSFLATDTSGNAHSSESFDCTIAVGP